MCDKMVFRKAGKFAVTILVGGMILFGGFRVHAWMWGHLPFELESEDGSKVFIFDFSHDTLAMQRRDPITPKMGVYYNTEPLELIYIVNLDVVDAPFTSRNLIFSECFRYMVFIPEWTWEDGTALEFYKDGVLLRRYMIRDLIRYPGAPSRGIAGQMLWENMESRTFNSENNRLSITTVDGIFPFPLSALPTGGRTFVFNITTGGIVARSPNIMRPSIGVLLVAIIFAAHRTHKKRKAIQQLSEQLHLAK